MNPYNRLLIALANETGYKISIRVPFSGDSSGLPVKVIHALHKMDILTTDSKPFTKEEISEIEKILKQIEKKGPTESVHVLVNLNIPDPIARVWFLLHLACTAGEKYSNIFGIYKSQEFDLLSSALSLKNWNACQEILNNDKALATGHLILTFSPEKCSANLHDVLKLLQETASNSKQENISINDIITSKEAFLEGITKTGMPASYHSQMIQSLNHKPSLYVSEVTPSEKVAVASSPYINGKLQVVIFQDAVHNKNTLVLQALAKNPAIISNIANSLAKYDNEKVAQALEQNPVAPKKTRSKK